MVMDGSPHVECSPARCAPTHRYRFGFTPIRFGSRTEQTVRLKAALDSWSGEGVVDPPDTLAFRLIELLGYRPGERFAIIAGLSEAGAGALLAVGFLTPLAGAAVVGVMLNAASALRGRGPWVTNGGWEYTVVLAAAGASFALAGPGSVSVDNALGLEWSAALSRGASRSASPPRS
jgi:putative oxidoreductase